MEKRSQYLKKISLDAKVVDQKLSKIKEVLKTVNWDYGSIFDDINGFIEVHSESSRRLHDAENEKTLLSGQLYKSEQKVRFITSKFKEHLGELSVLKADYQVKIDEMQNEKNELSLKLEQVSKSKIVNDTKAKELIEVLKKKDEILITYKNRIQSTESQLVELNRSFIEKFNKMKQQLIETSEVKEKSYEVRSARLVAELEDLQRKTMSLNAENVRLNQDLAELSKMQKDSKQVKDNLLQQKTLLTQKLEETSKAYKSGLSRIANLEQELMLAEQKDFDQKEIMKRVYGDLEHKTREVEKNKEDLSKSQSLIEGLKIQIQKRDVDCHALRTEIEELAQIKDSYVKLERIYTETKQNELSAKQQILDLTARIENLSQESRVLQNHGLAFKAEIKTLTEQEANLRARFDALVVKNKKETEEHDLQRAEIHRAYTEQEKKASNLEELIAKKDHESEAKSLKILELSAKIEEEGRRSENLRIELFGATQAKAKIDSEMRLMLKALTEMKDKVVQKSHEISELKSKYEDVKIFEGKFHQTSAELESERSHNQTLTSELKESNGRILELEDEKTALNQQKVETIERHEDEIVSIAKNHEAQLAEINEQHSLEVRRLTSDLQAEIIRVTRQLEAEKDELINSANAEKDELINSANAEKESMSLRLENEKNEISQTLNAEISELESTLRVIKSDLELRVSEIEILTIQQQDHLDANARLNTENVGLNTEIFNLKGIISSLESQSMIDQERIEQLEVDKIDLQERVEENQKKIESLEVRGADLQTRLDLEKATCTSMQEKIFVLEDKIEAAIKLEKDLHAEILRVEGLRASQITKTNELNDRLASSSTDVKRLTQELTDEKKNHRASIKSYDAKFKAANDEIESLLIDQKNLSNETELKDSKIGELEGVLKQKEEEIGLLTEDLNEQLAKILKLENKEQEMIDALKKVKAQNAELGIKIVQAAEKYDEGFKQKVNLEEYVEKNKELYASVKKKSAELEVSLQSVVNREEQLSHYSRWVDSLKGSIEKQVLKIAGELKASKDLSPLNRYLAITDREISKLEVLMTKSNVFGPQRIQLENQYELLVRQKEEVSELVAKSNVEVEERANALISTLKSNDFAPVPPLPPGGVIESKTPIMD